MDKSRIGITSGVVGLRRPEEDKSLPPVDNREVWREVDDLRNMVQIVTESVFNLRGRIEPVLRPTDNVCAEGVETKEQQIAPLADQVRQMRYLLGTAQLALSDMHERLEI